VQRQSSVTALTSRQYGDSPWKQLCKKTDRFIRYGVAPLQVCLTEMVSAFLQLLNLGEKGRGQREGRNFAIRGCNAPLSRENTPGVRSV